MRRSLLTTAITALLLGGFASDATSSAPRNFGVVVPGGIYRGGQPTSSGMKYLRELGVRTVVKLNHMRLDQEQEQAQRLGMKFVSLPLDPSSVGEQTSCTSVATAVAILSDRSTWPVYLHCTHGRDRTGLVVGGGQSLAFRSSSFFIPCAASAWASFTCNCSSRSPTSLLASVVTPPAFL